jgi:hypothetical protein
VRLTVAMAAYVGSIVAAIGRVNSGKRYRRFAELGADSCDGTFLAFGPRANLPKLLGWVREHAAAQPLWRSQ